MSQQRTNILFPVGRLVMGSLYKPRNQDAEGKPLVIKNGPDAGKPRVDYFVAVAIPKNPGEQAWHQTAWGQQILAAGAAAFPQAYQSPSFAWKVEDGDSQIPNKKGRKNVDNEGWRGSWVVKFSGGYAPKIVTADGSQQITEPDAVKLGYYVQVYGNVAGNGSVSQPGVYVNHNAIALAAYGPEISVGLDTTAVGFGGGALPAGASAVPLSGGFNPAAPAVAAPTLAAPAMPVAAPSMTAPAPTLVAPSPTFLPTPPAPVAPAAPAEPVLTPTGVAAGGTYAAFRGAGWSDLQLRQAGYIV
jgi:hypothetical protein